MCIFINKMFFKKEAFLAQTHFASIAGLCLNFLNVFPSPLCASDRPTQITCHHSAPIVGISNSLWHANSREEEVKRLEFRKPSVAPHNRPGSSLQSPNHPQPSLQTIFTTAPHKGPGPQPTSLLTTLSDDFLTSICMAPGTYKDGNTTFLVLCVQQRPER